MNVNFQRGFRQTQWTVTELNIGCQNPVPLATIYPKRHMSTIYNARITLDNIPAKTLWHNILTIEIIVNVCHNVKIHQCACMAGIVIILRLTGMLIACFFFPTTTFLYVFKLFVT